MKIVNSMLDLIGNIPLVRLNRIGKETGCEILVKPEFLNPSGSIKDRMALVLIETAEREGKLKPGMRIVEGSTGNTATSLAFVAAVKGYELTVHVPKRVANPQRLAIQKVYGKDVEIVDTDAMGETTELVLTEEEKETVRSSGAIHGNLIEYHPRAICRRKERENPDVWWSRQHSNPANVACHRDWTAKEILEATGGTLDGFVASIGTGGTLMGVGEALSKAVPGVHIIGVEPAGTPLTAGQTKEDLARRGRFEGILISIFDAEFIEEVWTVTDAEAIEMTHLLAEQEGMFCGVSSGANVVACLRLAKQLGPGKRIVTVLPDSRDRYLDVEQYTT